MTDEILTMQQAADYLKLNYHTVRNHRESWGFFIVSGTSRSWRVLKSVLDKKVNQHYDCNRSASLVGKENNSCRYSNVAKHGGLLSLHQVEKELENLLKQK
ncbi:helix-turn-helix domain-containing protein [Pasteurellaceae bacterium HPA106]|uniref:helix-turn-helix domain-containing protein n=1 Tax=Spirabiliibacterium pneumoniae TaxID=221400 RepID=UPI001AAD2928|nr:helix-turn-helix domain-containing protein [Spirabiliibacterium pneumoniae]MBE2895758.1 helix-turn-helix domain-containing protein [Spirabiliibacterium pneumoniae]